MKLTILLVTPLILSVSAFAQGQSGPCVAESFAHAMEIAYDQSPADSFDPMNSVVQSLTAQNVVRDVSIYSRAEQKVLSYRVFSRAPDCQSSVQWLGSVDASIYTASQHVNYAFGQNRRNPVPYQNNDPSDIVCNRIRHNGHRPTVDCYYGPHKGAWR